MPHFDNNADRMAADTIARWKATAASAVDDIGGWRDHARERIYRGGWPTTPPDFFAITTNLTGWLTQHHPKIDPSPLADIYSAVTAWYEDHGDERVPDQLALFATLERAMIALNAAEQVILGRTNGDTDDYRPASWFPKGMADRLRQAASPNRKGKRVRARTIDGVKCYSVADARRWWPSDVPRESP